MVVPATDVKFAIDQVRMLALEEGLTTQMMCAEVAVKYHQTTMGTMKKDIVEVVKSTCTRISTRNYVQVKPMMVFVYPSEVHVSLVPFLHIV